MLFTRAKLRLPEPGEALPGREAKIPVPSRHEVLGTPLEPPFPDGMRAGSSFGMGCFWGAERIFWQAPGVYTTAVGYAGGLHARTPPTRRSAAGRTGHTEAVLRRVRPGARSPTTRCCGCSGRATTRRRACARATTSARSTARRSTTLDDEQRAAAEASRDAFRRTLQTRGLRRHHDRDRRRAGPFYYAEDYHQQYLAKNPNGYCGLGGTGVSCPVGAGRASRRELRGPGPSRGEDAPRRASPTRRSPRSATTTSSSRRASRACCPTPSSSRSATSPTSRTCRRPRPPLDRGGDHQAQRRPRHQHGHDRTPSRCVEVKDG